MLVGACSIWEEKGWGIHFQCSLPVGCLCFSKEGHTSCWVVALNISYNCSWYLLSPLAHSGVVLPPFGFTIPCWFSWLYIHFSKYSGFLIKFVSINPFKCDIFFLLGSWLLYSNVMCNRHVFLFCHSIGIETKPENENQYSLKRSFCYKMIHLETHCDSCILLKKKKKKRYY